MSARVICRAVFVEIEVLSQFETVEDYLAGRPTIDEIKYHNQEAQRDFERAIEHQDWVEWPS